MEGSVLDIPLAKKELRAGMLHKRQALSKDDRKTKSNQISERLLTSSAFRAADTIHFYLAIRSEVQTDRMIAEAFRLKKRVAIPILHRQDKTLTLSAWIDANFLQPGPFGILTLPASLQKKIEPDEVQVWILPGVAFDIEGNRLGSGGGYYDRLLAKTDGIIIGLAFDVQVTNRIPMMDTDIPVDQIITESRIIFCKGVGHGGHAH